MFTRKERVPLGRRGPEGGLGRRPGVRVRGLLLEEDIGWVRAGSGAVVVPKSFSDGPNLALRAGERADEPVVDE
ncbi:hypothetical protein GCM10010334_84040 [Streptomyces finlayi]|uniref:Uncharacterized protein n=1 Tax=Streptomyces finlayi TaxID=67296 RepID=A0A919CG21_9ACTN|nr:hypothetical protein GCM10010334_84040 [Streptomyces finlayi]